MRTTELSLTPIKSYVLTLCDGKAVVRNQNRISGLISVRESSIPKQYHNLLAKATFLGGAVDESIAWTTDVFSDEPVRLSELHGEEHTRYKGILENALNEYARAFAKSDDNVKRLLYAAVTYGAEDSVFCANDRVVITEWGMTKKGSQGPIGMPMSIEDDHERKGHYAEDQQKYDLGYEIGDNDLKDQREKRDVDYPINDGKKEDNIPHTDTPVVYEDDNNKERTRNEEQKNARSALEDDKRDNDEYDKRQLRRDSDDINIEKRKKRKWWLWLLPLLLLLLALIAALLWSNGSSVLPETPESDSTQVVLSDDSLRYVIENKLLLLLTEEGASIDEFEKSFRKHYADNEKYILSNPDSVINRVTLTLPADERKEMEERLPNEFSEFGLVVIPETVYKHSYRSNDPGMSDDSKRWYFDECSVFDAWDMTMGSEDVVVAVIDDGFDLSHPELQKKLVKPYNAVTHTTNVRPSPSGHGTHVAATAVGVADNSQGLSGIAPKCKLMPIQVGAHDGTMTTSAIFDAVIYAIKNGADVVNMSLGMSFGPFVQFAPLFIQKNFRANMFKQEERVWNHLFNVARQNNVTFVIAGGNENCLVGLDPMQRSVNTIKVSAVQPDRSKASFSNYGDMSTVSAPGVRIYNAIPNGLYTFMDGTSMASPIVAGGCALLKSKNPDLTVAEMIQILRETGNPSSSDVGPVVNFAKALNVGAAESGSECAEVNKRYNELLAELEELKRQHPDCIQTPDTLSLPEGLTIEQLTGRWKSTTTLHNEQEEEVVIYFTFNGTHNATLDIVEPSGDIYTAGLTVEIVNDDVRIDQPSPAVCATTRKGYNPYRFVLKPDRNRKATGSAKNKVEAANSFEFNLVKI